MKESPPAQIALCKTCRVLSRRELLNSVICVAVGNSVVERADPRSEYRLHRDLVRLEQTSGGRLGVAFYSPSKGRHFGFRADERFPMCSTFKLLLVGCVLSRVDRGLEHLERLVRFETGDLMEYSPATKGRIGAPGMTVSDLCEAALTLSDNTAANLLLKSIGGPVAVTAFARSIGDRKTRLDRIEPDLNEALPGDLRDTSTPRLMAANMQKLTVGGVLRAASRDRLTNWLIHNQTGDARLRAGLPHNWKVGDKTGSGERGTSNDVCVAWLPGQSPIFIAAFLTGSTRDSKGRDAVVASVGRLVPR